MELVDGVARLCAMNLLLHGIGGDSGAYVPTLVKDALGAKHGEYEMVLTNPPFGKKSSVTIVNEAGDEEKQTLIVHREPLRFQRTRSRGHCGGCCSCRTRQHRDVRPGHDSARD